MYRAMPILLGMMLTSPGTFRAAYAPAVYCPYPHLKDIMD